MCLFARRFIDLRVERPRADASKGQTSSKLVFKVPSQDVANTPPAVPPLPDVTEPMTADKKKPPTYTGRWEGCLLMQKLISSAEFS